jgi:hypothetical protein
MNMSHSSRVASSAVRSSVQLVLVSSVFLAGAAGCAARSVEAPPATAASPEAPAPPSQASTGVAEQQASQQPTADDFVFVAKERKEATPQDNAAPATSLRAQPAAGKRMGHIESPQ